MSHPSTGSAEWIEAVIQSFWRDSEENSLKNASGETAFGQPLVGFSTGADPLYAELKSDIGSFHLTPAEAFAKSFPCSDPDPARLTVISWVLPQTAATKSDHRKETVYPSERWARSRHYGEIFNNSLRRHLAAALTEAGFDALAPSLAPFFKRETSEKYGFASTWSERHAAYVSGLGTFGLADGLITPVGKAVRCGSVIAGLSVAPTARPYTDHHAYCLHFSSGKCGKCIGRCPAQAISQSGHDKAKCGDYLDRTTFGYVKSRFGIETYACGLCQVGVPCQSRIPAHPGPKSGAERDLGRLGPP